MSRIQLENKRYWIWLSLIKGIGSKTKQNLLKKYSSPEKIYTLSKAELLAIRGIGEGLANHILDETHRKMVNKHIEYMWKHQIDIVTIEDENYPQMLKQIHDYPISLYVKGNAQILNQQAIAIVGCRDISEYGKKAAKYFGYQLTKQKIHVVSGLAKGVDSYAHIGAVYAGKETSCSQNYRNSQMECPKDVDNLKSSGKCGKTIAVVGNGLDTIYPQENTILANEILETGGAIITEYPLGTKPEKMNFPARNRIVSGMSKGVLVIEAKEKSGTLITVDFALEQGRDVYIVPGNINSLNSVGTNALIKQGAQLVTSYQEIVDNY